MRSAAFFLWPFRWQSLVSKSSISLCNLGHEFASGFQTMTCVVSLSTILASCVKLVRVPIGELLDSVRTSGPMPSVVAVPFCVDGRGLTLCNLNRPLSDSAPGAETRGQSIGRVKKGKRFGCRVRIFAKRASKNLGNSASVDATSGSELTLQLASVYQVRIA